MTQKNVTRRAFFKVAGAATGALATANFLVLPKNTAEAKPAFRSNPTTPYIKNRWPLLANPFVPLALGSVQAQGWLLEQLKLLAAGATGRSEEVYLELAGNSAWLGADQSTKAADSDWERPAYYVKGLVALAYTLNDYGLINKMQKWINWAITSQPTSGLYSGAFGPSWNYYDWWPRMPMLYAMKDYYEATNDQRAINFLTNYFRFQSANIAQYPVISWAKARVGDNIEVALWLYNRTGDDFLVQLVDTLKTQGFNFTDILANNNFAADAHAVNVAQYMKTPAILYQLSQNPDDRDAFAKGHQNLMKDHGQVTGMPSGTEFLAGKSSTQGVELCAIVERMQSNETAQMIIGNPAIGDQLEKIAFNALPGAMDKSCKIHQYYSLPNQFQSIRGNTGYAEDYYTGITLGPNSGFPCCRFNLHMGWAYYVKNMWAGTDDNGIAAMAYGPSQVKFKVSSDAVETTITESTNYPFEEQIRFQINVASAVAFPLKLRIPAWADQPTVLVNGVPENGVNAGSFFSIDRIWNDGDTVTLNVPMTLKSTTQVNNSVAIERGPLVFSLKMGENWSQTWTGPVGFNEYEIRPGNTWNYGLFLDRNHPEKSITVQMSTMPQNPFIAETTPIKLIASARKVAWSTVQGGLFSAEVQPSPIVSHNPTEGITLVPFGAQNSRITYFPQATD